MGLKTISPERLHQAIADTTVIDVNAPLSWSTNRVPGAINLDPLAFKANDLPADKNASLVFYCSNFMCRKAPNAAKRAEQMGYRNVQVMSAGIAGWINAKLPTESGA
jgi:rhodanese-related sulfurtransferase